MTQNSAALFINKTQLADAVITHLGQDVEIKPYEAFLPYLKDLVGTGLVKTDQVWFHDQLSKCCLINAV